MTSRGIHINKRSVLPLICIILLLSSLLPLASAIAALPSYDPQAGEIRLGAQDEGGQIELKEGQVSVIGLESNPSTGDGWEVEKANETVLHQTGRIEFNPASHLIGAPGKQVLRFEAVAAGQTTDVYLPFIARAEDCQPIPGESYGALPASGRPPNDPPAEAHPDLNLALRGYDPTDAYRGLVDYGGERDPNAPQLYGLFYDNRTATFSAVYQVYDWDWGCGCRGGRITNPEVTLAGLAVTPGETIHVPDSGYTIGQGYEVLVLYASTDRITLKYTPEDNVIYGYTLHVENICVEPTLLALYQSLNAAGRSYLPALRARQAFGRARGHEIGVAIRDAGTFMDPRSRKDWWWGR